jgi:lipoprotein LprG
MSPLHGSGARAASRLGAGGLCVALLWGCGSSPPDPAALVRQTSAHMNALHAYHFALAVAGFTGSAMPVRGAEGDARPPDLHARVQLAEGSVLLEVETIVVGGRVYLKSFTGGWQLLTSAEVAQFFDVQALFDPQIGLFSAMAATATVSDGGQVSISGHSTRMVTGRLDAARVHQLLPAARAEGQDTATYWIEPPSTLWRASLRGPLFDPLKEATITFDFSAHDHPVTITPPPVG